VIPMLAFDLTSFQDLLDEPMLYYHFPDHYLSTDIDNITDRFIKKLFTVLSIPYMPCCSNRGFNSMVLNKHVDVLDKIINFTKMLYLENSSDTYINPTSF
jgi:hypothetical protein